MGQQIPQSFIDDLLVRVDIVELISQRIKLKKAGKDYQACCPFHNEKTPSFTVSAQKQFYHCFGCGAHGSALRFIMEYDNLSFPEAIEELASHLGIPVPYEQASGSLPHQPVDKQAYELMNRACRLYQLQLRQSPKAVNYLKKRGLDGETAKRFSLGYAPPGWRFLSEEFAHAPPSLLNTTGLCVYKDTPEEGCYDRFRDRIMFPIRDKRGRVIAFGGRVLDEQTPKYLNSPETPLFHKGNELYGLYELKENCRNNPRILVVEGYMDVVALSQHQIDYAVASLGTATTPEQFKQLYRHTDHIVCCYDGDRAGQEAAWRALQNVLPLLREGLHLSFCFLPDGEDPDSFIRAQGQTAFEEKLDQSLSFIDFLLERLCSQADNTSEKTLIVARAIEQIKKIPSGLNQEQAITQLSRVLRWGEGETRLRRLLQKYTAPPSASTSPLAKVKLTPVRRAIALVLQHPEKAAQLPLMEEIKELKGDGFQLLYALLEQVHKVPDLTTARLLESWHTHPHQQALAKLATLDLFAGSAEEELRDLLLGFFDACLQQRIELLQTTSQHRELTSVETQKLLRYLKLLQNE